MVGDRAFSACRHYMIMTELEREALRLKLEFEWLKIRDDYAVAGKPFGEGRGLEIWVEFGQLTTTN